MIIIPKLSLVNTLSDNEFISIINGSFSLVEVARKIGYKNWKAGGSRDAIKNRIQKLDISTLHFKTNGRQYEKPPKNKIIQLDKVFTNPSYYNSVTVKDIIIREKLIEYKCAICDNKGNWNNIELKLQLHHKNGKRTDNTRENLEFLCPNCHSQTNTFGGKNYNRQVKKFYCTECNNEITKDTRTGLCKKCVNKKIFTKKRPTKENLIQTILELKSIKNTCFKYHVSDHTLYKWLKEYDLPHHIHDLIKYLNSRILT